MTAFAAVAAAILGACIGSFLNVVIHRVPRNESIVKPASRCPSCGTALRSRDNIPIVSWLVLGGRCRTCSAPIAKRYVVVEIVTALYWAACVVRFGVTEAGALVAVAGSVLIALALIDLEHRRLPNVIVLPSLVGALSWTLVSALVRSDLSSFATAVACGAAAFGVLLLIALVSGGMGMGDVKLAAFIGVVTGWFGGFVTLAAILFGFLIGGLTAIVLLVVRRAGRKTAMPFGPALAAGCIVAIFVGEGPVRSYFGY
jgi:leader peptidase (prepilin peptidase)/N-methyltransferase